MLLLATGLGLVAAPAWAGPTDKDKPADTRPATEAAAQAAAEAPAEPAAEPAHASPDKPKGGLKAMASGAAASTLTLLLPHVATGDEGNNLLGRSGMVASDLGRLLSSAESHKEDQASGANEKVQSLLKRALTLLGTPYRWGGSSPDSGFDCSGLVSYVFRSALGIELPRVSREMARKEDALLIKDRSQLREGDLVFFSRSKGRVDHVGIYVGNGQFVHAPRTGKDVEVASLVSGYWAGKFLQARRVQL